jgi:hypothetical protein
MNCFIYTKEELKTKIEAIDIELAAGIKRSELETTTDQQEFELDTAQLEKQRNYYLNMYQQICLSEEDGGGLTYLEPKGGPLFDD